MLIEAGHRISVSVARDFPRALRSAPVCNIWATCSVGKAGRGIKFRN
jgi:hypothetical protein